MNPHRLQRPRLPGTSGAGPSRIADLTMCGRIAAARLCPQASRELAP